MPVAPGAGGSGELGAGGSGELGAGGSVELGAGGSTAAGGLDGFDAGGLVDLRVGEDGFEPGGDFSTSSSAILQELQNKFQGS